MRYVAMGVAGLEWYLLGNYGLFESVIFGIAVFMMFAGSYVFANRKEVSTGVYIAEMFAIIVSICACSAVLICAISF